MTTLRDQYAQAELSLAAYAVLGFGEIGVQALINAGFAEGQATRFASQWRVVDQRSEAISGLSVTVFENIETETQYLAIRGTEAGSAMDLLTGFVDIGLLGTTLLQPQYSLLKTYVQQWLSDGTLSSSFTVTGHSLGGFLATGLAADFSANVTHAYLYNSPGVGGAFGIANGLGLILKALGIVNPVDEWRVSNIKADAWISPVAGLGSQVAPPTWIAIENQLAGIAEPPGARNHSQQVLTDALALYAMVGRLAPALSSPFNPSASLYAHSSLYIFISGGHDDHAASSSECDRMTTRRRLLLVIGAFVVLIVGYYEARKYMGDQEVRRLCLIDGGAYVYERVQVPRDLIDKYGDVQFPDRTKDRPFGGSYAYVATSTPLKQGRPTIERFEQVLMRTHDGKILGRKVTYMRRGGDMWGPWADSSFMCADASGDVLLSRQIFVVEIR